MQYRADIDGLRAIAVLAVVLFHLKLEVFSGGYVGVDVFFVISGFLITSIIRREIELGEFSFAGFYERRFRRILPAMFAMVIVVLLTSALLFDPAKFQSVGESAASTLLFGANIYFEHAVGYFDSHAETKPLLHMWSLGVEEQFYIFLPLILLLLHKRYKSVTIPKVLVLLILSSFVAAAWNIDKKPTETFYLLHFRAWELLCGSLLAYVTPYQGSKLKASLISLLGLGLVLFSVFGFDVDTLFPGPSAFIPVFGASLIIWAGGRGNLISKLLSIKPFVWFGLISYSLYLWHWPVIVFFEHISLAGFETNNVWMMFMCSVLLAYASWKFIETPVRKRTNEVSADRVVGGGLAASLVFILLSCVVIYNDGFPHRQYGGDLTEFYQGKDTWDHWHACERVAKDMDATEELCSLGSESATVSVVVWGDSHAISLAPAIDQTLKDSGQKGVFITRNGCPPLLNTSRVKKPACSRFNARVSEYINNHPTLGSVILVSRWSAFATGRLSEGQEQVITLVDLDKTSGKQNNLDVFEAGFARTIDSLAERKLNVLVVEQVPETQYDVPTISYLLEVFQGMGSDRFLPQLSNYELRHRDVAKVFSEYRTHKNVSFFDPAAHLCNGNACDIVKNGKPLYIDDNHLSVDGAMHLQRALANTLLQPLAKIRVGDTD